MKSSLSTRILGALCLAALCALPTGAQQANTGIQRVLLISIDGMHALDMANCAKGIGGTGGPTCPNLVQLSQGGVTYVQAATAKPSDSYPGLVAIVTGASPRTSGIFYDVSYDRALSPSMTTTPYGIPGGAGLCPGTRGTQAGFEEEIDFDYTKLDGAGGINPAYLPRDPNNGCAPVYPHTYLRVNTIFEVIKANGGYTAWSDKHPAYEIVNGPSGKGVNDLFNPEINSGVVALPNVPGCATILDSTATGAWTDSFQNIQCYDSIKVQSTLNQIDGKLHDGSASAPVPTIFGMNFQAVSVGQKLVTAKATGGYLDAMGTPSASLLNEIQFVDKSVGQFVSELKKQGLYQSTMIVITAKHGQSPIDPSAVMRIPADNPAGASPSKILGGLVASAAEDDVSLLWLTDQTQTANAVATLQSKTNEQAFGGGEIFAGTSLGFQFNDPSLDSRTPDIIVTPSIGVVYTGGKKKVSEHGGFANDDTNVIMLVAGPGITPAVSTSPVRTAQVAPTILKALGLNPQSLQAAQKEGTQPLPGLPF